MGKWGSAHEVWGSNPRYPQQFEHWVTLYNSSDKSSIYCIKEGLGDVPQATMTTYNMLVFVEGKVRIFVSYICSNLPSESRTLTGVSFESPTGNRLDPRLDVIKSPLAQHREDAVHMVWYTGWSSQTRHAPTLQSISFPGRTYHRQESRFHTWPGTHHEGSRFQSCVNRATFSCAKFVQSGTHYLHPPFELWCMLSSVHASISPTASSTGRARIFLIVFSRSWIPQRAWFWKSGNTTRSQPLFDGISIGYRSKLVFNSSWTSSQEIVSWVKPQHTWPSSVTLSTRSRRGATYYRQHKSSSWSLVSVRSALVVVVSPSHHRNCGTYFQLTFDSYTRATAFQKETQNSLYAAVHSSPPEDLCHQCDIYFYYNRTPRLV